MKKYLLLLILFSAMGQCLTFWELFQDYPDMNIPLFGNPGVPKKVCFIHDSSGRFVPFGIFNRNSKSLCDLKDLAEKQRQALKTTNPNVDIIIQNHNPGDPNCYQNQEVNPNPLPSW